MSHPVTTCRTVTGRVLEAEQMVVQQRQNWMQTFPFKGENALWKKGEALTVQEHAIHVELA